MRQRTFDQPGPKYADLTAGRIRVAILFWGVLFGSIGLGYFMYGKRQAAVMPMLCGAGLMVFPYFVSSTLWLIVVGAGLTIAPWYWR